MVEPSKSVAIPAEPSRSHQSSGEKKAPQEILALLAVISELLFVLLPFVVIALILAYKGELRNIFSAPEWSLASAVLFGQAIVKIFVGVLRSGGKAQADTMGVIVTGGIVIGLCPSLVILGLVQLSAAPPEWLVITQMTAFCVAVIYYLTFGWIVEWAVRVNNERARRVSSAKPDEEGRDVTLKHNY